MGERFYERFPSITAACREIGIDPARDRIPVAPASHYACGGIRAGLDGATAVRGLYAVGEVACTGVHGANRLASNSLTESVVSGTRVGRDLAWELPGTCRPVNGRTWRPQRPRPTPVCPDGRLLDPVRTTEVRAVMSRHVAVLRDAALAGDRRRRARRDHPHARRRRRPVACGMGGHQPADRRRRDRRRRDRPDREPRVSPAHRPSRAPRRVAHPPGRAARPGGRARRRRHPGRRLITRRADRWSGRDVSRSTGCVARPRTRPSGREP